VTFYNTPVTFDNIGYDTKFNGNVIFLDNYTPTSLESIKFKGPVIFDNSINLIDSTKFKGPVTFDNSGVDTRFKGRVLFDNSGVDTTFKGRVLFENIVESVLGFGTGSDYRIKSNVSKLTDTSFTIDMLNPVFYYNEKSSKNDIGFIAHELQEHFPFLVNGEKDGYSLQSVNYTGLIGLLVQEVQILKEKVKKLETRT
jgi:hypothetical protein